MPSSPPWSHPRPRIVFFDLDGTLLDHDVPFAAVFVQTLRRHGIETTEEDVTRAMRASWAWFSEHLLRFTDDELGLWRGFNQQVCAAVGAGPRADTAGAAVTEAFVHLDRPRLFDDAVPCLDALEGAGIRLGIITARPDAARVVAPLGIHRRFAVIVDAFTCHSAKVDPRPYAHALRDARVRPHEALHVGDHPDHDVAWARAAGMRAVLLDRRDEHGELDVPRVPDLRSLALLLTG